ncbi:hypothetical protein H9P43_001061 [Blastocladiella emersonii ATCC 22665]|nr:hypothetical protein H9P43_001061 [Blastocladiella emersonii ATCC 22665]
MRASNVLAVTLSVLLVAFATLANSAPVTVPLSPVPAPVPELTKREPSMRIVRRIVRVTRTVTVTARATATATNPPRGQVDAIVTERPTATATVTTSRGGYYVPEPTPTPPAADPIVLPPIPSNVAIPLGGPTAASVDISYAMVAAVNAVRAAAGLPAYSVDKKLAESCNGHSLDQAKNNFMGHNGSTGSNPASRASAENYDWTFIAENVAEGQNSLKQVMNDWMNSPGHKANILSAKAQDFAAAVARSASGTYYWTQCFGVGQ